MIEPCQYCLLFVDKKSCQYHERGMCGTEAVRTLGLEAALVELFNQVVEMRKDQQSLQHQVSVLQKQLEKRCRTTQISTSVESKLTL